MGKIVKKIRSIVNIITIKMLNGNNVKFGKKIGLLSGFKITKSKDSVIKIGDEVFFNRYCSINCLKKITIGDNCIFGESVKLYDHNHKYKNFNKKIKEQGFSVGEIVIGNNCWIGSNVTILKNVIIGDNVIIGANCLIFQSIPSNSVVKSNLKIKIESLD